MGAEAAAWEGRGGLCGSLEACMRQASQLPLPSGLLGPDPAPHPTGPVLSCQLCQPQHLCPARSLWAWPPGTSLPSWSPCSLPASGASVWEQQGLQPHGWPRWGLGQSLLPGLPPAAPAPVPRPSASRTPPSRALTAGARARAGRRADAGRGRRAFLVPVRSGPLKLALLPSPLSQVGTLSP